MTPNIRKYERAAFVGSPTDPEDVARWIVANMDKMLGPMRRVNLYPPHDSPEGYVCALGNHLFEESLDRHLLKGTFIFEIPSLLICGRTAVLDGYFPSCGHLPFATLKPASASSVEVTIDRYGCEAIVKSLFDAIPAAQLLSRVLHEQFPRMKLDALHDMLLRKCYLMAKEGRGEQLQPALISVEDIEAYLEDVRKLRRDSGKIAHAVISSLARLEGRKDAEHLELQRTIAAAALEFGRRHYVVPRHGRQLIAEIKVSQYRDLRPRAHVSVDVAFDTATTHSRRESVLRGNMATSFAVRRTSYRGIQSRIVWDGEIGAVKVIPASELRVT